MFWSAFLSSVGTNWLVLVISIAVGCGWWFVNRITLEIMAGSFLWYCIVLVALPGFWFDLSWLHAEPCLCNAHLVSFLSSFYCRWFGCPLVHRAGVVCWVLISQCEVFRVFVVLGPVALGNGLS